MSLSRTRLPNASSGLSWSLTPTDPGGGAMGFFSSAHWSSVLSTLGARCWYGCGNRPEDRLFVFRRGGMRVAFAGFPVTPAGFTGLSDGLPERVDLIRINHSCLDADVHAAHSRKVQRLPESVIPALSEWPRRNAKKLAKDRAYSRRQPVRLEPAKPADAAAIFEIYRSTVSRNGGALRYSLEYFRKLLSPEEHVPSLLMLVARSSIDDSLAGFCFAAMNSGRGYYLHGGVDLKYRALGVSDLLLGEAIGWAKGEGGVEFTMMASPPEQSGLISFKRKWSEFDGAWETADVGLTMLGRALETALRCRSAFRRR